MANKAGATLFHHVTNEKLFVKCYGCRYWPKRRPFTMTYICSVIPSKTFNINI